MLEMLGTVWRRMTDKVIKEAHGSSEGTLPALSWMEKTAATVWNLSPEAGPWMRFFLHVQVVVVQGLTELVSEEGGLGVNRATKAGVVRTIGRVLGMVTPKACTGTNAIGAYKIPQDIFSNPEAIKVTGLLHSSAYTELKSGVKQTVKEIAEGGCDGMWLECVRDVVGRDGIQNSKAIGLFFTRWDDGSMSSDAKIDVLNVLEEYFNDKNEEAERNRSMVSAGATLTDSGGGGLLSRMLSLYPNLPPPGFLAANSIIRNLGRQWINVPLVKRLFFMMGSNRGGDLEWLLEAVCGMAVRQYQPKRSFLHSGFLSGFHFSLPPNFLPRRGYALSLGVYINPPKNKAGMEEEEEMCLSWIGDGNGNELCISLTPAPKPNLYYVKVRVRKAAGSLDSFVAFDGLPLKTRTWYALSVTHSNLGTGPWLRSEVVVCARMMGEDKSRIELGRKLLPYTQWAKRAEGVACLLCPPSTHPRSNGARITYFKGSTTGVWLYRGPVTDEAAANGVGGELRGGDECLRIIPGEQRDQRHPATQSPAPITRRASAPSSPAKKAKAPSPARRTTTLSSQPRNNAPQSVNAPSPAPLIHDSSVIRLPGTETSFSMSFTDALDCMGGLSCVFPLFAQIDQPTTTPSGGSMDYGCNPRLSLSLIKLVGDLIKSSSSSRSIMVERGGFELISYFLSSLDPRHMTSELLATIFDLEEVSRQYPALHSSIVMELIANFKIWVYSPAEVQIELMNRMYDSIQTSPQFAVCVRSEKTIQGLLESLHMLFWRSPPSIKRDNHNIQTLPPVYRDRQRIHPVTKAVVGTRATGDDLNKIRNKVYSLVLALLEVDKEGKSKVVVEWEECRRGLGNVAAAEGGGDSGGASSAEGEQVNVPMWPITDEETRAVFHSLILADDNRDRKAKLELLGILLHLSLNEINAIPLTRHILDGASQGFHFLMSMVGDMDEGIRIFVVLIFASLSHNHYADPLTLYPPPQSLSRQSSKGMHGGGFNMYVPPPTLMRSMSGRTLDNLGLSAGAAQQSGASSLYQSSSSNLASSQQKLGGSFSHSQESFSNSTHFYNPQATFAPASAPESVSSSSSVTFGSPSRKKADSSASASLASNQRNLKNQGSTSLLLRFCVCYQKKMISWSIRTFWYKGMAENHEKCQVRNKPISQK